MFGTSNIIINTLEELHKYVSEEDIYTHYVGEFSNNTWIVSPFRPTEKVPSFRINYYNNSWVWTDFGLDPRPKNAVALVMNLYNIEYIDALNKIYQEVYLNNDHTILIKKAIKTENKTYCKIRKEYHQFELDYWNKVDIKKEDLLYWKIYCGEIRNKGIVWHSSIQNDPLFIYMFDIQASIFKGYRPFAPSNKQKFYSNNITGHIQGWDKLPDKGNIVIITKSYKDVIIWWKLGYPAIAPHSENMFISPANLYELESRFKHIYINYDNDETGVKKSIQYSSEHNLKYFNLPKATNCKDPFQFVVCNSYNDLNNLFLEKQKRDGTT